MAANPIPGLVLPAPNDVTGRRTPDNLNAIGRWSKGISPLLFGIGAPIVGTNPPKPPSNAYLLQRGLVVVNFTSGTGILTLPKAFPNGWLSLEMTGFYSFTYNPAGATLQEIDVGSSGLGSGNQAIDIDALGW